MAYFVHNSIGLLAPLAKRAAYLDPGTGSFLLQLLLASLLGGLVLLRTFWGRIKGFFGRVFSKDKTGVQPPDGETPEDDA